MDNFHTTLKQLRTDKGFSQEVFASKIDVHVTNLSKYERGKSIPSLEIAVKMANVLDVSIDQLVYGLNDQKAKVKITEHELISLFDKTQKLSEDQKNTVIDLLSAFILKANIQKQL